MNTPAANRGAGEATTARPRRRRSTFRTALLISAALHLSAVTLFTVVIYFPREDLKFFDVRYVQVDSPPRSTPASGLSDDFPDLPGGALTLRGAESVTLPTLEFAELSRLRVRQSPVEARETYERLFGDARGESPGFLGQGLRRLQQTLAGITGAREVSPPAPITLRPAEGFEGFIEWRGPPADRALLFAPPIPALWDAPVSVPDIEVILAVDPEGAVVNAWSPAADATGLIDEIQLAALKYRFAPLGIDTASQQMATLHIRRSRPAP